MKNSILIILLFITNMGFSQISNKGEFSVKQGTILGLKEEVNNYSNGVIVNDGDIYIYKNIQFPKAA